MSRMYDNDWARVGMLLQQSYKNSAGFFWPLPGEEALCNWVILTLGAQVLYRQIGRDIGVDVIRAIWTQTALILKVHAWCVDERTRKRTKVVKRNVTRGNWVKNRST
jgi:hypothetical protein